MAAKLDSVARYICDRADWSISNLKLQKLMYLVQMIYMGRNGGRRLFDGTFQAWDYGPVEPTLYQKCKMFGAAPVKNVFSDALAFKATDPRKVVMNDVCDRFLKFSAGDLVEITHWDDGAWAKYYVPGARSIDIPDEAIFDEYTTRNAA